MPDLADKGEARNRREEANARACAGTPGDTALDGMVQSNEIRRGSPHDIGIGDSVIMPPSDMLMIRHKPMSPSGDIRYPPERPDTNVAASRDLRLAIGPRVRRSSRPCSVHGPFPRLANGLDRSDVGACPLQMLFELALAPAAAAIGPKHHCSSELQCSATRRYMSRSSAVGALRLLSRASIRRSDQ